MVKVKITISEMEMTNMFDKDAFSLAHLCDKGLSLYPQIRKRPPWGDTKTGPVGNGDAA